jgi:hypothetical protein
MPEEDLRPQFTSSPSDPLAAEHEAVIRWASDASKARQEFLWPYWKDVDLKTLNSGRVFLGAKPEQARRHILAALAQTQFLSDRMAEVLATTKSDLDRANMHGNRAWAKLGAVRRPIISLLSALLRRAIPFECDDLVLLVKVCMSAVEYSLTAEGKWSQSVWHLQFCVAGHVPGGLVVKTLQRYAAVAGMDEELKELAAGLAKKLRGTWDEKEKRWGAELEQLIAVTFPEKSQLAALEVFRPVPKPGPVGHPLVLNRLKSMLGIAFADGAVAVTQMGLDRFEMPAESPLREAHERLSSFLSEAAATKKFRSDMHQFPAGQDIFALDEEQRGKVLVAACERHIAELFAPFPDYAETEHWRAFCAVSGTVQPLASSGVRFNRDLLFDFLIYLLVRPQGEHIWKEMDTFLFDSIAVFTNDGKDLTEGERYVLHLWRRTRITGPPLGFHTPDIVQLTRWIGDGVQFFLVPGEYWSDAVNADLAAQARPVREAWLALLKHLLSATMARPSDRWRKTGRELIAKIGEQQFRDALEHWLPLVAKGRMTLGTPAFVRDTRGVTDTIQDENANALRGFLWMIPLLPWREELARLVSAVAISTYKKIPGVGPRAVKVGNAAVYCLSQMVSPEAMGQLAMLKVRVRFGTAQKEIEKAFDAAAAELDLPRDQVEEMSVPACGLETVGLREETLGKYRAQLVVNGSEAVLRWFDAQGKQLKSMPAAVKSENAETVKELQTDLKDIQSMLSAQRERIDALFLEQKAWPLEIWRERYVDHPLVGTIARRLIWVIQGTPVTVIDGVVADVEGHTLESPPDAAVHLWHPAGRSVEEVIAWRRRIESLGIVQPFKQAHREVYLLTDAERRTSTYSNRFAAHILRQHQFNALCAARRWKNKLRLMVDDTYPPANRELRAWNLRAEFWIEGVGDQYGQDTNDSGVFLRLVSDQVRFYRLDAATSLAHAGGGGYTTRAAGPGADNLNEPLPLEQIPTLAFSEIMRDVDLFVGVASVGNDPTWQDGGPGGRYVEYWQNYSFGELSGTAVSRRETLEHLLPRLKIAGRCVLADRFLLVKGSRRTYKIHLGSGNILMEPNDQYLCIVPDARARSSNEPVYLPFEGDTTLSIILSKAFLLADDGKIKDETINRQIDRR